MKVETDFLQPENAELARKLWNSIEHDAWLRFWNEDKVQIDSDMNLGELKTLVQIMESFSRK